MSADFRQKRIWITGASSGIGEALSIAFAAGNAHLILSARNQQELERVGAACRDAGAASVVIQPLDLAKYLEMEHIAADLLRQFGKIDILVNNGGISKRALAMETSLAVDKQLFDINYFGTIALTKAVLPSMLTHQLGHIVVMSSLTGKFSTPYRSSYAASKHALHGFFDSLRAELANTPIKVTLICPGRVKTNVSINALKGDGKHQGTMDGGIEQGMDPERLAGKILKAIQQGREEVYYGGKEVLGVYIKRFFPLLFSRIIKSAKVI
ncbi:MAG: SDR family oxidoreductase [Lewinellaceae bacterium]|nr:SDR family oxidoreductase [Lewinellaceae bacterium]